MKIAIAVPHGHAAKWLQVIIHSIKSHRNNEGADIYVGCTWPSHPSIRAVTQTELGEGVTIVNCKRRFYSHATALEEILEHIADKGYTHLFCCETDCQVMKDGWLDWFSSHMQDERVGIAGFFWHEGKNHFNINPSGTMYRVDMLLKYHAEVRANKRGMFWHPEENIPDSDSRMDSSIKDVAGAFSETRGLEQPTPIQREHIANGIPHPAWWEPGQWLYVRALGEWQEARVYCDHIYEQVAGHKTPEGTYYGGKADPWYIHYWGGTRCYDFLKHPVSCNFVKSCAPHWIKREDRIWKQTVPEKYRNPVHNLLKDAKVDEMMQQNMGFVVNEVM